MNILDLVHVISLGCGAVFVLGLVVMAVCAYKAARVLAEAFERAYGQRTHFEQIRWQMEREDRQKSVDTLKRLAAEARENAQCRHASVAD